MYNYANLFASIIRNNYAQPMRHSEQSETIQLKKYFMNKCYLK
jgi:hypothetical protein